MNTFELENINVVGVFSHLAKAESDMEFTKTQIFRFDEMVNFMTKKNMAKIPFGKN